MAKPMQFSISSLLVLILICAVGLFVWKNQPMDHFELAVAGELVAKLPEGAQLKIFRNPDYKRSLQNYQLNLTDLPVQISNQWRDTGCVVEFHAPDPHGQTEKLFSIVVDREMFDEFRVITLRLDRPTPVLHPDFDCWDSQVWSACITKRMRYRDLPWWDSKLQRLAKISALPEMNVTNKKSNELLQKVPLRHESCLFDYAFGYFDVDKSPKLADQDELIFSVNYDSGGLFEPIKTEFHFRYNEKRHRF